MNLTTTQSHIKTVLELDLASYSDTARALEENISVEVVKLFQDQIQNFVDQALGRVQLRREDIVFGTAGDSALLFFDEADAMHNFTKALVRITSEHNRSKSFESAKRWFRIGAATGLVLVIPEERRIVGMTVARAVRLEAAADIGELVIDTETFKALPEELQKCYGSEEIISGKRNERFNVRRCRFISPAERAMIQNGKISTPQSVGNCNVSKVQVVKSVLVVGAITALVLLIMMAVKKFIPTEADTSEPIIFLIGAPLFFYVTFRLLLKSVKDFTGILMGLTERAGGSSASLTRTEDRRNTSERNVPSVSPHVPSEGILCGK